MEVDAKIFILFLFVIIFLFFAMRSFLVVLSLALFALCATALVIKPTHKEPLGWRRHAEPLPHEKIRLQIALKQRQMDVLEKTLLRVSDPREATYGQWLSLEEIAEIIAPSWDDIELVYSWLESYEYVTCVHCVFYNLLIF